MQPTAIGPRWLVLRNTAASQAEWRTQFRNRIEELLSVRDDCQSIDTTSVGFLNSKKKSLCSTLHHCSWTRKAFLYSGRCNLLAFLTQARVNQRALCCETRNVLLDGFCNYQFIATLLLRILKICTLKVRLCSQRCWWFRPPDSSH